MSSGLCPEAPGGQAKFEIASRKPHEITDQQTKIMKLVTQMSKFSCTSSNSIAGTRSIAAWSRHKEDASKVTAEEETESSP